MSVSNESNWFANFLPYSQLENVEISKPFEDKRQTTKTPDGKANCYIIHQFEEINGQMYGLHYELFQSYTLKRWEIDFDQISHCDYKQNTVIYEDSLYVTEFPSKQNTIVTTESNKVSVYKASWIKFTEESEFVKIEHDDNLSFTEVALKVDDSTKEMNIWHDRLKPENHYQTDKTTGYLFYNESKHEIRCKHLVLSLLTPLLFPLHALALTVNTLFLIAKVLSCANAFSKARVYEEEGFWKSQARDIGRIVMAPFALIGFLLNPFFGLIAPINARKIYGNMESFMYGHTLFAKCMQPQRIGYKRVIAFNIGPFEFYKLKKEDNSSKQLNAKPLTKTSYDDKIENCEKLKAHI